MDINHSYFKCAIAVLLIWTTHVTNQVFANPVPNDTIVSDDNDIAADSVVAEMMSDAVRVAASDTSRGSKDAAVAADTFSIKVPKALRDWRTWHPNPQRALWLALVIPGAGQIYNRKYWKLPLFYGGVVGCIYAMRWNNMMYRDYSQAYLDIMDDDPRSKSYEQFMHGRVIDDSNAERYKELFRKRKDYYRRYRDLSFFCLVGVYALSVIDAYVDAELSEFDISKDLSLRVSPSVMGNPMAASSLHSSSVGVKCSLRF